MSRHVIDTPPDWPAHYKIAVGWDGGLHTYFGQVIDRKEDSTIVWIGTIDTIYTIDQLERQLNACLPPELSEVEIDNALKSQLESDRREEQ